ncbi:hypothetical protein HY450_03480 [Candidatus Pacearchaeota archaeon]|nr:hypothetical protein [Candidatus Pacearchaeota archaeon]
MNIVGDGAKVFYKPKENSDAPFREAIYQGRAAESDLRTLTDDQEIIKKFSGKHLITLAVKDEDTKAMQELRVPMHEWRLTDGYAVDADELYWSDSQALPGERLIRYLFEQRRQSLRKT